MEQGKAQSLQYIAQDGAKLFLTNGKKQGGYFHIAAEDGRKDGPLCIAEGYSTAASICTSTGYACLVSFDAGNLLPVATMAREKYPERKIILCADNDIKADGPNVGLDKATVAAKAINGLLAIPPSHEGKPTDFNDLHQWRGLEAVRACIDAATLVKTDNEDVETPLALRREPRPQAPYPVNAFGLLSEAVDTLAHTVKVPEAMAGASVLAALAFCVQGVANVVMRDGRTIPTSLNCITIADSGDRKTALDNVVSQAITSMEREQYKVYNVQLKAFEQAKVAAEKRPKAEREAKPFDQEPPQNPAMVLENINAEGLFRALKEGRPSLAIFSDEGGTLFGGQAFLKDNTLKTITFFSKLWDGSPVDKARAGEGFSRLYDRRVSMHLMMQPTVAEKVVNDELLQGQGFLPRFLVAWPTSLKGSRHYSEANARSHHAVQAFYGICEGLLRMPLRIDDETGSLIFDSLCLDIEAHDLWVMYHNRIEELLAPEHELSIVSATASKSAEQALRIAGVLCLANDRGSRTIDAQCMANGISLAQWYLLEALRYKEEGVTPQEILKAEKLLRWMRERDVKKISLQYIQNKGPNVLRLKKEAEHAIQTLEEHGYVCKGSGRVMINGKWSRTFWDVVPC